MAKQLSCAFFYNPANKGWEGMMSLAVGLSWIRRSRETKKLVRSEVNRISVTVEITDQVQLKYLITQLPS
jgi:hypothetical protein